MNLNQQIQNITSEFTARIDAEIMSKVKAILDRNFPFSDVDEMTAFELFEFMKSNNLVVEVTMYNGEITRSDEYAFAVNTTIVVKIFRKEELL